MGRGSSQRALLNLEPLVSASAPSTPGRSPTKFITLAFHPTRTLRLTWNTSGGVLLEVLSATAHPFSVPTSRRGLLLWLSALDAACKPNGRPDVHAHGFFILVRVDDEVILKVSDNQGSFHQVATASITSVRAFLQQAKLEKLY